MALPYCIPYFDAHCDTLTKFNSLRQSSRNHIDLLRLHHYRPRRAGHGDLGTAGL